MKFTKFKIFIEILLSKDHMWRIHFPKNIEPMLQLMLQRRRTLHKINRNVTKSLLGDRAESKTKNICRKKNMCSHAARFQHGKKFPTHIFLLPLVSLTFFVPFLHYSCGTRSR